VRQAYDEVLMALVDENKVRAREYGESTVDFFVKTIYGLIAVLIILTAISEVHRAYSPQPKKERTRYGNY
jgi:hypothetical protein